MENDNEKDALPNLETVLNAINALRGELSDFRSEVNARLTNVEADSTQVKEMRFVFENEFDRLTAAANHILSLSYESRPQIRSMRKEISAWARDVRVLERKVA